VRKLSLGTAQGFARAWGITLAIIAAGLLWLTFRPHAEVLSSRDLTLQACLLIGVASFICEYFDSSLGMGYGTTLTPVLMLLGMAPTDIVPAVLMSQMCAGLAAGLAHHTVGNVRFERGSRALKVMWVLAACSVVGTVAAVLVAVNLPAQALKLWIGLLILVIGIVMIIHRKTELRFSWRRIVGLGLVAAFNKGLSGGGYGPIVTGGQVMAGVSEKSAVAITSLAEGLTCLVGLLTVFLTTGFHAWTLALSLCVGALISVPMSALTVKIMPPAALRGFIGYVTLYLGALTLIKLLVL
jgi:uncharacterized membrane protein YfcA